MDSPGWLGLDDLDLAIVWKQLHVGWTVKQHFTWDGWHRVGQRPQLIATMGKAAVLSKLADPSLLEVPTYLSLVIAMDSSDVVLAWEVLWHRLNKLTL